MYGYYACSGFGGFRFTRGAHRLGMWSHIMAVLADLAQVRGFTEVACAALRLSSHWLLSSFSYFISLVSPGFCDHYSNDEVLVLS